MFQIYWNDLFLDEDYLDIANKNLRGDKIQIKTYSSSELCSKLTESYDFGSKLSDSVQFNVDDIFYKIYFIDISRGNNNLKIYFKNQDNNYTNGFMTKSTFVVLECLYIIPEKIFYNYKDFENKYIYTRKNTSKDENKLKRYYKNKDLVLFGNYKKYCMWKGKNGQEFRCDNVGVKCGGDGYFELDTKTKYNIIIPKNSYPIGAIPVETHTRIDKYKQGFRLNENQRNYN